MGHSDKDLRSSGTHVYMYGYTCRIMSITHSHFVQKASSHSLRMQFHWLPTCNMNSEDLNLNVNQLCNLFAHIIRFLMFVDYITNSYMYYYISTCYNEHQSHVLNLDLAKGTSVRGF